MIDHRASPIPPLRHLLPRLAAGLMAALIAVPALAQNGPIPPGTPQEAPKAAPPQQAPKAEQAAPAPPSVPTVTIECSASLTGENAPIRSGLVWRIFKEKADRSGMAMVARSIAPEPAFTLPEGSYIVHVSYGFASAIRKIEANHTLKEHFKIAAGALRIKGTVGDMPIPPSKLKFSVYVPIGQNTEGRLVVADARPTDIIRLPEGNYHVVSTYGDSNAIMRADLHVDNGKVTEATLNHRAATVTLKLVRKPGGEAFAGTAFSVLTPGGDVIREAIGAFPSFILAEGEYVVIARYDGKVYSHEFKVQSGMDRDVEVLVK